MHDKTYDYTWMGDRIRAMIDNAHSNNKKFIWGIGGWSDLQYTIRHDQVDSFVKMCVDIIKEYGDGIDFNWKHLEQFADGNPSDRAQ